MNQTISRGTRGDSDERECMAGDLGRCVVIGGAGGIGQKLCRRLADAGWDLTIAGRDQDKTNSFASEVGAEAVTLDATDMRAVADLVSSAENVRGLVNLAGSILLKPAHLTTPEEFDETIGLNLRTAFAVTRAASGAMRKTGGSVVLMSSCAASTGLVNHEAISAAKAGVEGLVRAAAATYSTPGIRFNAVAPGLVDTPLASQITGNETSLKASVSMHPLGRIGEADEIARAIEFLLSPESSWITGQVIGIDGGLARVRGR